MFRSKPRVITRREQLVHMFVTTYGSAQQLCRNGAGQDDVVLSNGTPSKGTMGQSRRSCARNSSSSFWDSDTLSRFQRHMNSPPVKGAHQRRACSKHRLRTAGMLLQGSWRAGGSLLRSWMMGWCGCLMSRATRMWRLRWGCSCCSGG